MRVMKVIDTLKVGNNTLIAVDDPCEDIKNGYGVIDENGKPHEIISIGTNNNKKSINITNILIEGDIKAKKIFV